MKVAIVTSFPRDPDRPHGGVEAVSVNLVRALARRPDLEVEVVTTDPTIHSAEVYSLPAGEPDPLPGASCGRGQPSSVGALRFRTSSLSSFTVHRLPAPRSSLLRYAVSRGRCQVQDYLLRLKPDVSHAHDFYGLMTQGLAMPRAFTIHGFIHEDTRYGKGSVAWLRGWLWRVFETAAWREQPHVIAISPYVRERLRGIARGVVHDIENPIAAACFDVKRNPQSHMIFCAAVVSRRKNTLGLLKAVYHLRRQNLSVELRLAGGASEPAYEQQARDYVSTHGLGSCVSFLGKLSADQVRAELARAGVFALVSFEEGAPMGIAEAMAAGVPVVASNRCGMPYMVRDGEAGFLVDPNNPLEIARRLQQLLDYPELRQGMGQAAHAFAREHFHPDRVAKRTLQVYRAAVGRVAESFCGPPDQRVQPSPTAVTPPAPAAGQSHAAR